jgi:hypothetical protein
LVAKCGYRDELKKLSVDLVFAFFRLPVSVCPLHHLALIQLIDDGTFRLGEWLEPEALPRPAPGDGTICEALTTNWPSSSGTVSMEAPSCGAAMLLVLP